MIKLVAIGEDKDKQIFYLRKEDIMSISEDDDGDIEIVFKDSVLDVELTIEKTTIFDLETGLDYPPDTQCVLKREFYF